MLPGPDEVLACPKCGALHRRRTLASSNDLGMVVWSDGKREAEMNPASIDITRCHACTGYFWCDDAKIVGEYDAFSANDAKVPAAWLDAPYLSVLDAAGLLNALEQGAGRDRQRERYLRLHCWWAVNDVDRDPQRRQPTTVPEDIHEANLRQLLNLLNETPSESLFRAEIHRQLGEFQQAIDLLRLLPDDYDWVSRPIMEFARRQDRRVQLIEPD